MASADPSSELRKVEEELAQVEQQISQLLQKRSDLERKRKFLKRDISQLNSVDEQTDWERSDFPWSKRLHESKESVFGINKLRPLQEKTMNVFLSGKDCILIMPTGGGKSLCFQLPAISSKGLTLVVCPLVSLMEDQIMSLHTLGVDAALLNSNSTKEEVNKINTALTDKKSTLKLLYVTPEKLAKSKRFMSKLEKSYEMGVLSRIVIDEVHCCSQWGHDFRPDYKFLGIMKRQFPKCPILGLTATATVHVVNDVKKMLNLSRCLLFTASFNRPNLYYEVYQKPSNASETLDSIQKIIFNQYKDQSGIVYCLTQKDCEEVTAGLQSRGIRAGCYHGNMDARQRSHVHRKWTTNDLQVVVATVAFGMGIDKANVRFVIHHSISKSMENYYQESGRAGRDDAKSHCILFYSFSDIARQSTMVFTEQTGLENLYKMVAYCNAVARCRRSMIAEHFNESWSESDCSGMCDACVKPGGILSKDVSRYCKDVMTIIEQAASKQIRITALKLIDAWNGKGATNLRNSKVKPPMLTRPSCEKLLVFMLLEGYLREDFHFTPYSTISYIVAGSRKVNDSQILLDFATKTKSGNSNSSQADSSQGLNESQGLNNSKQVNNAQRLNKPSKDLTEKTNSGERKQKQNISKKKRKSMKPVETTYDSDFDELDALNAPSKKKRKRKINTGNNSKISSSVEDECILLESENEHDSYEGQQEKLSKDDVEVLWDSDESIDSTLHSVYEKQLEGLGVGIK